jgi:hypothetical protein
VIAFGGWGAALFPLAATVVALVFAARLARRLASRFRPHEALWAVALLMFAAASLAMSVGVGGGWTAGEFRAYWLFGAVLNVPYLAQGELYLLFRGRVWAHLCLGLLLIGTVFAVWKVLGADVRTASLAKSLPLGKDVFGNHSAPYRISQLYAFPAYFLLLGGSVWSALRMRGRPELMDRTVGTLGIAVGATIVAIGSGIGAGYDIVPLFSVSLAAGIAAMFWGFIRASRPGSPAGREGRPRPRA